MRHRILIFIAILATLVVLHAPYLRMPFHWDELGQFVPASLDLLRDGSWVTHTAEPNIHPPGLMAMLAAWWKITGFSVLSSRLAMLFLSAIGVYYAFLLAIRLARGTAGAPAFAAVAFLIAAPMFYTQSMMVLLDMPAMVFTMLALLLFYEERFLACAAVCTILVLVKETSITTPMVFGAWLLFRDRRVKQALYFFVPAVALGIWLIVLKKATGSWFGNAGFAQYNVADSLTPLHVAYAIVRRAYTLFLADGHWIGTISLIFGWRLLRGRDWSVALWVAVAQLIPVTVLGGAVLDRYLLPILPILYAAFAVAVSSYTPTRRLVSHVALLGLLILGWFVNSPFPVPLENNLAVVDFVYLQKEAAEYIESNFRGSTVVTTWPLSIALRRPDNGYVQTRLRTREPKGQHVDDILAAQPGPGDPVVLYSRGGPPRGLLRRIPYLDALTARFGDPRPEADGFEMEAAGFRSIARWTRGSHWIEIYVPGR